MRRHTRLTRATRTERTETTRDPQKQKQKQGNCPARTHTTEAGQGPARLPRICWGGPHACEARLGSHGAATHTLPPKHTHSHKYTQAHPRHGRRRTKTLAARRVEDAEEVGPPRGGPPGWRGVGPLSPFNALRLQTARGKSALVASVATGRRGRDCVRLMHGRADPERKGAGSRAQAGRGMAGWDGLGSAPQKLDLQMPI